MKPFTILLAAGAVLAASVNHSSAQTAGPFTTSTPIATTLTDFSGDLLFPRFNPALGTLDSVTLDFSSSMCSTLSAENMGGLASRGSAYTDLQITVEDGGLNFVSTDPELDLSTSFFHYTLAPGNSASSGLLTASGSSDNTYSSSPILAEFTGRGNISLTASTLTETVQGNSGGNTEVDQVTHANLTGTVQYNYTPAHVPDAASTGGLLALSFGAVTVLRRQRKN